MTDKKIRAIHKGIQLPTAEDEVKVPNPKNTGELMEGVITDETVMELINIVGGRILADLQTDIKGIVKTVI